MKNVLIVFFIVCFFIMVLVFPFKVRCMGHFNILKLIGFYSLKIMNLKLINGRIMFRDGKLQIENSVNRIENGLSSGFTQNFTKELLSKLDVKKVELFFSGGIADNSFSSAIICGTISAFINSIYSIFSQKYENVKLYEDVDAKFGENNFEITFDIVISISFIAIIVSVLKALKLKNREAKNERWSFKK